jgi:septum formation topological specificity factor MinE|tara:strand:+ start:2150 stop:2293 length:144 start_codon:yes stop_codon:yes gene_type:complete
MFNFLKRKKVQKERLKQVITKDRKETEKENKKMIMLLFYSAFLSSSL